MKPITRHIHRIVSFLRLDGLFASISSYLTFFYKIIPTNKEYNPEYETQVKRGGVHFKLRLADYMQWHVYANLPEPLWEYSWRLLHTDPVLFDLGANIGAFSLKSAKKLDQKNFDYRIYSFEPNKEIVNQLKENLELNPDLSTNITVIPKALSSSEGTMFFQTEDENTGAGKLIAKGSKNMVEVTTVDSFVSQNNIEKIDLIKIDVEGHEPKVLEGAQHTIEKFKPILIIEITDQWFRSFDSSAYEIIEMLSSLGYNLMSDKTGKAKPFSIGESEDFNHQFNILAFHDSN